MTAGDVLGSAYTFFAIIVLAMAILLTGNRIKVKDSKKKSKKKK